MPPPGPPNRKTRRFFNDPGDAHEFTFSCYKRLPLLSADRTRDWLIDAIANARLRYQFSLLAYVIMPEHAHLLIHPRRRDYRMENISKTIKQSVARRALGWLRQYDAAWLERLRGEHAAGRIRYHFWQPGGGYDRNLHRLNTIAASIDYLHENPVRRGLVGRAVDFNWSSARWYAGLEGSPLPADRPEL